MARSSPVKHETLIPFIVTTALYFVLIEHTERGTTPSTVLKCMPIVSLLFFGALTDLQAKQARRYKRMILLGLFCSSWGDLLLNYNLFEAGMGAFGVAQICYVNAFGFQPLRPAVGVVLYAGGVLATSVFFANLNSVIKVCLPIYAVLLLTMCWRALARIQTRNHKLQVLCGVCSVLFVISDGIIAFDKFFTPISAAQTYIMLTYYAAQLGITLSITDGTIGTSKNTKAKAQ
ncbi:lysoplasmalogenase-like protein TMEM86A [Anopheles aquasalis]|uniref:lysoplasmalogenase-like protein TMEM86A n=1 Tax=Anopheles aquasalis TaxID=42839 RepID=UPI00215B0CFD|nr:lysoplasmalogenase-like protein TMEM86A [Anopheles aquasalis]